ncbi:MAG: vWA domain-containing protein [Sporichthyaceae bacterium]
MNDNRLGGSLARKPLRFIWLLDTSGSMAADGKIQALNVAVREAVPHLRQAALTNPSTELLLQALAFSTTLRWIVPDPTPVEEFRWSDIREEPQGRTELGLALRELAGTAEQMTATNRGYAPVFVLVSDGQPTNLSDPSFRQGLAELAAQPWGSKALRLAVGIGRDVEQGVLKEFIGHSEIEPLRADNPDQLAAAIRFVSTVAVRNSGSSQQLTVVAEALARQTAVSTAPADVVW